MRRGAWLLAALLAACGAAPARADRAPVLQQVDLPHSYYWRELYLPQLTTGPSAVSFTPDGASLVYSMAGSLWRQRIDGDAAIELTHADGAYDYQPDVAPDGRSVVFARYDGRSIELWRLDLASGREEALTRGGAVNVEPRLSPDGRRIAWVSTQGTGHFNLFVAELDEHGLHGARPLLGERRSVVDRYYYSPVDHAVNPAWSPDGATLYFVSNAEVAWGSGDVWAVNVSDPAQRHRVLSEETTWSAHPEPAPAGQRLLYSSYRGRAWHQLWLTTAGGAAPLPLTFGDFDARNARWSPDGEHIAYISNERGNTGLVLLDVIGGARRFIEPRQRSYLRAPSRLVLDIVDDRGRRTPARVAVLASDGRAYAPADAWMHADDGFDRARQAMETHYFHCAPPCTLELPAGTASVTVQHGFAWLPWQRSVELAAGAASALRAELVAQPLPAEYGDFVSADLHVHMNYGGHYRNTPANLAGQARAEDLDVVYDLIVNKEERIPDLAWFRPGPDPASTPEVSILHAQEYHTSFWGHLGLLHLGDHLLLPDFSSYRHTALASPYPHNGVIADLAHAQGGLVGYVHPYDWRIVPAREKTLSHALPADAIAGKVDYVEVMGFSDHKATAEVWYRLLNLGFHLPAGAGTDAMANYASLRGPVGLNRVFLETGGRREPDALKAALAAGRGFVSNGPLLGLSLDGVRPGGSLPAARGSHAYRVALRSPVPVDHLELVQNGRVVKAFTLRGERRTLDAAGALRLAGGGWLLLRAWNEAADPGVLDLYPYATTSPIYLAGPAPRRVREQDAAYFVTWMDRLLAEAAARDDYNDAREKGATLDYLRRARDGYRALAGEESVQ
jgi:Tol biopolymer transport system component